MSSFLTGQCCGLVLFAWFHTHSLQSILYPSVVVSNPFKTESRLYHFPASNLQWFVIFLQIKPNPIQWLARLWPLTLTSFYTFLPVSLHPSHAGPFSSPLSHRSHLCHEAFPQPAILFSISLYVSLSAHFPFSSNDTYLERFSLAIQRKLASPS